MHLITPCRAAACCLHHAPPGIIAQPGRRGLLLCPALPCSAMLCPALPRLAAAIRSRFSISVSVLQSLLQSSYRIIVSRYAQCRIIGITRHFSNFAYDSKTIFSCQAIIHGNIIFLQHSLISLSKREQAGQAVPPGPACCCPADPRARPLVYVSFLYPGLFYAAFLLSCCALFLYAV